jgi:plasmid stabilization system protein ParE
MPIARAGLCPCQSRRMAGVLGNISRVTPPKAGAALSEVIWTEPALGHLEAIRVCIEQFNPKVARDGAASLKEFGDSLAASPRRGQPVRGDGLREPVRTYPYAPEGLIRREFHHQPPWHDRARNSRPGCTATIRQQRSLQARPDARLVRQPQRL